MKYCVHFIFINKQVLLLKRKKTNPFFPNIWTPIIGKIKADEKPIHATVRETMEETNIHISDPIFFKQDTYQQDNYWFYYSSTFPSPILLNHENETYQLFKLNELPDSLWSLFKKAIMDVSFLG